MDCLAVVLLLLLGTSLQAAGAHGIQQRIPKIIHRNYMAGASALQAATAGSQPDFKAHWLASCTVSPPMLRWECQAAHRPAPDPLLYVSSYRRITQGGRR